MSETKTKINKQSEQVVAQGRPVYDTWDVNPDDCTPYDGVEYVGHRLGQVWADMKDLSKPPMRACREWQQTPSGQAGSSSGVVNINNKAKE